MQNIGSGSGGDDTILVPDLCVSDCPETPDMGIIRVKRSGIMLKSSRLAFVRARPTVEVNLCSKEWIVLSPAAHQKCSKDVLSQMNAADQGETPTHKVTQPSFRQDAPKILRRLAETMCDVVVWGPRPSARNFSRVSSFSISFWSLAVPDFAGDVGDAKLILAVAE